MAIRRPLIDAIERGMNPGSPHTKLDKKGSLIVSEASPGPVLAAESIKKVVPQVAKPVLTESKPAEKAPEVKVTEKEKVEETKPSKEAVVNKSEKSSKPV
jgi:hypothetical protein